MAGKLKNFENEKNTVSPGIWIETLKKVENEKCTLQDLEYGKKTANHGKLETHNVGPGIWQETLKNVKNEQCTPQDLKCGQKNEKYKK